MAHPYQTVDPELVAAHIIAVAQGIVLRNTRPIDVAVLSLCAIRASDRDAMRVGPGEVTLVGTVHTFDAGGQLPKERRLAERCSAVTQGCCPGRRCGSTASICVTLNNRDQARFAGDVAERLVGSERLVRDMKPIIGDEDFSFMLQAEPVCTCASARGGGD